jgi:cholesterol transport system auxiliary component
MKPIPRLAAVAALSLALGACSLGGLLGGGKAPPYLLTLTSQAPATGEFTRSAAPGEAVTISTPIIPKELRTVRIPVHVTPTAIEYVTDLQWADTPDKLFQTLIAESVTRMTRRVVLDSDQATLDPGLVVSGQLSRFGYDDSEGAVVVRYDAALSTAGGTRVETRRFESKVPSTADAAGIGPALNTAANQVAMDVAKWIGG